MIRFTCPNCQKSLCHRQPLAKVICPCGQTIRVPSPPPAASNPTTLGNWQPAPPPIHSDQRAAPLERCYDCGDLIPEGRVHRRTVEVGSSYTSGSISAWTSPGNGLASGSYGGSTSSHAKVSLCGRCNWERDERERLAAEDYQHLLKSCVVVFIGLLILILGVIGYLAWLLPWLRAQASGRPFR
jgi:hypothetical protein